MKAEPFASITKATGPELLPDLQTLKPKDFEIVSVRMRNTTERRLCFDNEIVNTGKEALELYPVQDSSYTVAVVAYQRIFEDTNGYVTFERGTNGVAQEVPVASAAWFFTHNTSTWKTSPVTI